MHTDMTRKFVTTGVAAKQLRISVRTAQQWVEKGWLDGWKTSGGHRRIALESIERARGHSHSFQSGEPKALPILIIEDNLSLLRLYREHISRWSFPVEIHVASDGYDGLILAGEVAPALLICDLRLPGLSGFEIVRTLSKKDRFSKTLIIVISGLPKNEVDAHGGIPPTVQLMRKPIDFSCLQANGERLWLSQPRPRLITR